MSIVALKRKSKRFQAPISGRGQDGFSLVGGYRNVGLVGPTNLAKSVTRTSFRGNAPMGHGGCNGAYKISISNSGSCYTNDSSIIKSTVKNTKGAILQQYKWIHSAYPNFWVKPGDSMSENFSQGSYIRDLTSQYSNCVVNNENTEIKNCNSYVDTYTDNIEEISLFEYNYPPALLNNASNATTLLGKSYGNGNYNVTYSSENISSEARNLFDGSGVWQPTTTDGAWVQLQLPNPIVLHSYQVNTDIGEALGVPTQFKLEGSNDNFVTSVLLNTTTWGINQWSRTIILSPPLTVNQSFTYFKLTNLGEGHSTDYIKFKYPLIFFEERNPDNQYPPIAMTSNTTIVTGNIYGNGNYIASSSSNGAGSPWHTFDDTDNFWRSGYVYPNPTTSTITNTGLILGEWIQLQIPVAIKLKSFLITPNTTINPRPKQVKLLGSNNPTDTWNILYETDLLEYNTIIYVNYTQSYSYYRLVILTVNPIINYTELREITFFEEPTPVIKYPPRLLNNSLNTTMVSEESYGNGVYNVSSSQESLSREARNLFAGINYWRLDQEYTINGWVQLELPNPIVLYSYQVNTNIGTGTGVPTQFKLEGSNNNFVTRVLLNITTWGETEGSRTIIINPPVNQSFTYFRLTNLAGGYLTNYIEFKYPLIFFEEHKPLPLVGYPPIAMTADSLNVNGNTYGNGNYIASASDSATGLLPFNAFNDTTAQWRSVSLYPTTTNVTNTPTGYTNTTAGPIIGEWIQLQLPNAIKLKSFVIALNSSSGTHPSKAKLLGSNNPANAWNILYETDDMPYSNLRPTTIYVNANELYTYYRLVILTGGGTQPYVNIVELTFFEEYQSTSVLSSYTRNKIACKSASYHIGGKKYYKSFYSKNTNNRPISSSQYIKTSLYKKNNLPTPPCLQSFPIKLLHNGCNVNYFTPQQAIAAGALPSDWMNCNPITNPYCDFTTFTFDELNGIIDVTNKLISIFSNGGDINVPKGRFLIQYTVEDSGGVIIYNLNKNTKVICDPETIFIADNLDNDMIRYWNMGPDVKFEWYGGTFYQYNQKVSTVVPAPQYLARPGNQGASATCDGLSIRSANVGGTNSCVIDGVKFYAGDTINKPDEELHWIDAGGDSGIFVDSFNNIIVRNCKFVANRDLGIYLSRLSSSVLIENNTFINCCNAVSGKRGVTNATFRSNDITNCVRGISIEYIAPEEGEEEFNNANNIIIHDNTETKCNKFIALTHTNNFNIYENKATSLGTTTVDGFIITYPDVACCININNSSNGTIENNKFAGVTNGLLDNSTLSPTVGLFKIDNSINITRTNNTFIY